MLFGLDGMLYMHPFLVPYGERLRVTLAVEETSRRKTKTTSSAVQT